MISVKIGSLLCCHFFSGICSEVGKINEPKDGTKLALKLVPASIHSEVGKHKIWEDIDLINQSTPSSIKM